MPSPKSEQPLASGQVFDRPQYPDAVALQSLIDYRAAHLAFVDSYKDATRHDQAQLYDSVVARFRDFLGHAVAQLKTEGDGLLKSLKEEIEAAGLDRGTMLQCDATMENVANIVEYCLIDRGYFMAKRKPVFAPYDVPARHP